MDDKNYKKTHKPALCTTQAWRNLVKGPNKDNILRQIRQETLEKYSYSMDECPKRLVCMGTSCIGRPLPWLSETAKPYLEELKKTHSVINDELFLSKCDTCPVFKNCKVACHQINDFLTRHRLKEPDFVYQKVVDNHTIIPSDDYSRTNPLNTPDIPWDCLNQQRHDIIRKYLYESKDFLAIAKELNMSNQSAVKYQFYAGLTTLSEFAAMRAFLKENKEALILDNPDNYDVLRELYEDNASITSLAKKRGRSKQAIQQRLTRLIKKYKVKWTIFVKKQNNKVIYNVPMVFK